MKAEADRADQAGAEDIERNSMGAAARAEADLATHPRTKAEVATTSLMEAAVDRSNLMLAYQRVLENKGAAGVDQLAVSALKEHLKRHWLVIQPDCWRAGINRRPCAAWTSRSRKAGCVRSAFRRWWIGSFSRR